jgi:hypothetical protein
MLFTLADIRQLVEQLEQQQQPRVENGGYNNNNNNNNHYDYHRKQEQLTVEEICQLLCIRAQRPLFRYYDTLSNNNNNSRSSSPLALSRSHSSSIATNQHTMMPPTHLLNTKLLILINRYYQ